MMPRFKNPAMKRALQPRRKQEYIRIHLDATGSAIWLEIDGNINVLELCNRVQAAHPDKLDPPGETEKRVTDFLSKLYQERYITFREIMAEKKQDRD